MPPRLDITGRHFGRWTVLGPAGRNHHRQSLWSVVCDPERGGCGRPAERTAADLRKSNSCGCLRAEQLAARNRSRRDGMGRVSGNNPKPLRPCDQCGRKYLPGRAGSRFCSDRCRALHRWRQIAADPVRKKGHAARVTDDHKRQTYVRHDACEHCGRPFVGPPTRLHCSRECLGEVVRAGKYRSRFHRRRVEAESAALAAELQRRLTDVPAR